METLQAHGDLFARVFLVLVATVTILYLKRLLLTPLRRCASAASSSSPPSLPCPRGLPLIGNLHQLGAVPHDALAALSARHAAPLMLLRLGSVPTLVVSTADALRAAFQPNDRAMSGRPALCAATRITYGLQDIVFSHPDGAFWRAARRASLSELLSAPRVRGFRDVREGEAASLVAATADMSRTGTPVNLSEKLMATSNKILRRVAFGDDSGERSIEAGTVLDETQYLLGAFFVSDYMPWLGWLDTLRGLRRRLERNFHELDAFYEKVIDDHLNKRAGSKGEDLVDVLLRLLGDPAYRSTFNSRDQIKGILTDMFIAGTDTAAATVEWTMTELINHPDILAKAQQEVRGVVVDDGDIVRESDLPRLKYLKQVIRESMRVHPPVPLLVPRETIEPCTVYGCEIPAGTRVFVNAKAIGQDPDAWGPDAARFVPERHEEIADLSDHKPWHDSFSLVPFGVGRRSCPGVHFATSVVELLLANLLFCFDWRVPHGGQVDLEQEIGLTVHRKNPLVLIAERRCVK
ncbi:Cytochrome P450 71A9 [Dichanthelium oligosanthes]|uniref:Cytochrome P450 71A9 n=1 Tax=Dichanthelium oligosanthes TaxID=888268 RepID=A0A1E5W502_9POAL|nr:Cytochrome P450 71A9 [Dichanthelium oligosanthes]